MNSFFVRVDTAQNPRNIFWSPVDEEWEEDIEANKVHEGHLSSIRGRERFKDYYYILTKEYIYRFRVDNRLVNPSPHKACRINWKVVDAYCEDGNNELRYGFRIFSGDAFCDFYTSNSSDLDTWMAKLSSLAILTNFDEDYDIIKEIGKGTNSTVYLCRSKADSVQYAVKCIGKKILCNCNNAQKALIDEINIMRLLSHPRIVKLHKVYESETCIYLVMDYLRGSDMHHRISKRGKFFEETAAKFTRKILETLEYIHSVNIVHRDIKPENILMVNLLDDTEFKLGDFGIATFVHENLKLLCGSPRYIAPEILREEGYGVKVDIFSLGIIVYMLLSGTLPFGNNGAPQKHVLNYNRRCKLDFANPVWKSISTEAVEFVRALTSKNPADRPTAKEALLHPWLNMAHLPSPTIHEFKPDSNTTFSQTSRRLSGVFANKLSRSNIKSDFCKLEPFDIKPIDPNSKLSLTSFPSSFKVIAIQSTHVLIELSNNDTYFKPIPFNFKPPRHKSQMSPECRIESPQPIFNNSSRCYLTFSEALEEVSRRGLRIGGSPCAKRTHLYEH